MKPIFIASSTIQGLKPAELWGAFFMLAIFSAIFLGRLTQSYTKSQRPHSSSKHLTFGVLLLGLFPKLLVATYSSYLGDFSLALASIMGSITFNFGVLFALLILFQSSQTNSPTTSKSIWTFLGYYIFFIIMIFPFSGPWTAYKLGSFITREQGYLFIIFAAIYLLGIYKSQSPLSAKPSNQESDERKNSPPLLSLMAILTTLFLLLTVDVSKHLSSSLEGGSLVLGGTIIGALLCAPEAILLWKSYKSGSDTLKFNPIPLSVFTLLAGIGFSALINAGGMMIEPFFFASVFPFVILVALLIRIGASAKSAEKISQSISIALLASYWIVYIKNLINREF